MDVTSENFREVLPLVFQAIDDADFVSFDGEFSGLRRSTAKQAYSVMDTIEDRYNKMAASVREFGFIQFGLSCFKFINDKHTCDTATFSFYLLKEKTKMSEPNTFTVCSNSLRFLANANFDFNKLFKEGLTYLNLQEAHFLRDQLPQKINQHLGYNIDKPAVPDLCMSLYNLIVKQIKKDTHEMKSQSESSCEITTFNSSNGRSGSSSSVGIIFSSRPSPDDLIQCPLSQLHSPQNYIPPPCRTLSYNLNNFKRQCWETLRVVLVKTFSNVDATIDYGASTMAVLVFANGDDRDLYVYYSRIDELYNKVGFSHVVTHLLSAGKPLVGHNCILDVLHIVDKCLEPLPLTLEEFKELYRANFSAVYDTKVIVKEAPFAHELDNTTLENVYTTVVSSKYCPVIHTMAGQSSYTLSSESLVKQHDGGYDAFITGVTFAGITQSLSRPRGQHHSTVTFDHLEKYKDRLHLMKICDLESIHLSGEDDPVDRRGVLVVMAPVNVRHNMVRTFFPDLTNPIIVTDALAKCFYVLPANEKDKVMSPSLINKARFIAGSAVTVSLYETPSLLYQADAAMEAGSPSLPTYASMKGSENQSLLISIPPSLPVSPQSPDESLLCTSPPMTPRTAYHLATISTLSAKSPEFTPSANKSNSKSSNTVSSKRLYSNIVSDPQPKIQTAVKQGVAKVHHACSTADLSTESCNSSKGKVSESDKSKGKSTQELHGAESTQPEAFAPSKRGEKRKSGNYNDYSKNSQQCSAATGFRNQRNQNFQAKSKGKPCPNDWKTVSNNRNRNKKSWRYNKFSSQANNRFGPITNDKETGLESPEPQSAAEGKWCGTTSGKRSETGRSKRSLAGASDDDADSDGVSVAAAATALEDTPHADSRRLKRLKSVGAEKLSEMSLNSPTIDEKPFLDPFHQVAVPIVPTDVSSWHLETSANSSTIITRSLCGHATAPVAAAQPNLSRRRSKSDQQRSTRVNPNTEETQNGDGDVFVVPDQW